MRRVQQEVHDAVLSAATYAGPHGAETKQMPGLWQIVCGETTAASPFQVSFIYTHMP